MTKKDLIEYWLKIGINKKIIKAFLYIAREKFTLPEYLTSAYQDVPLPILEEQTISQPTTVALMLNYLDVKENNKILEIGTGSGYNAALLSQLTKNKIITVERIKELVNYAKNNLKEYKNITVVHGDGSKGYAAEAPYDRIIITCAAPKILPAWEKQLKEKGILVVPLGDAEQEMIVAKKIKGKLILENKGLFRFVPLLEGKR